jgi:hypothetical protein
MALDLKRLQRKQPAAWRVMLYTGGTHFSINQRQRGIVSLPSVKPLLDALLTAAMAQGRPQNRRQTWLPIAKPNLAWTTLASMASSKYRDMT